MLISDFQRLVSAHQTAVAGVNAFGGLGLLPLWWGGRKEKVGASVFPAEYEEKINKELLGAGCTVGLRPFVEQQSCDKEFSLFCHAQPIASKTKEAKKRLKGVAKEGANMLAHATDLTPAFHTGKKTDGRCEKG